MQSNRVTLQLECWPELSLRHQLEKREAMLRAIRRCPAGPGLVTRVARRLRMTKQAFCYRFIKLFGPNAFTV